MSNTHIYCNTLKKQNIHISFSPVTNPISAMQQRLLN